MIGAILRAQWRSMRWGRGSGLAVVAAIAWYGIWTAMAIGAGFFCASAALADIRSALPLGILAVCAYWQLVPILSATMGSSLDMRKLLVYPVPHGRLFLVEVLLRITTALEMLLVVVASGIGLLSNASIGGLSEAPRLLAAGALFIAFNLLLSSGLRSVLERLLSKRRVREVLALVVALLWVLPRFLMALEYKPKGLMRFGGALQAVGLPWTAMADILAPSGSHPEVWAWISIFGWACLALWFGRSQFERNLRYDAIAAQSTPIAAARPRTSIIERFYALPSILWRDPLAAIVEKELRSMARTPRFRMVFIMGFTFGLVVWFPMIARGHGRATHSPYFLVIVCVYALSMLGQVSFFNSFGFDRSAAGFYFAAPQPISKTLLGKNIAAMIYIFLEVFILCGVTAALQLTDGWTDILRTLLALAVCSLYLVGIGNVSSVRFPRALTPERVAQGGSSRSLNGLMFLLYPLSLAPVALAYLAEFALDSEIAFAVVMLIAAAVGAIVYRQCMQSAVATASTDREAILQELSRGDGPVVSG